jgi:hypothetical protein
MRGAQQVSARGATNQMKRYLVTWLVLALVALIFIGYPQRFTQSGASAGQRRGTRRPAPTTAKKPGTDYSTFSHATKEHKGACNTCHKVPTDNWKKVREFPDVADFPDHDACVRCHRPQFFKGPQPVICRDCHLKTSPRDEARLSFRNPDRPQQFTIEFPHDKHQDVIAELRRLLEPASSFKIRRASFTFPVHAADDKTKTYNNCEICHATPTKLPAAPPKGWVDNFVPEVTTFKTSPMGHASCFNCHFKSQPPLNDDCVGCHKLASPYVPNAAPERISMKFKHSREQHLGECTICHINITKAATLRGLKPDVPIFPSCANSSCHEKQVNEELDKLGASPTFKCLYCHTSDVLSKKTPDSHFLAVGRKAPGR